MIKIRIAVAVNVDGNWSASGFSNDTQNHAEHIATEGLDYDFGKKSHVVWVEAEVPLPPQPPVVQGVVS